MRNLVLSFTCFAVACGALLSPASACEPASDHCETNYRARYVYVPRVVIPKRHTAKKPAAMQMEAGASYRLAGGDYGIDLGSIVLQVGELEFECDVLTWSSDEVTFQVPALKMKRITDGSLNIVSINGRLLTSKPIRLKGIVVERSAPIQVVPPAEILEPLPSTSSPVIEAFPSPRSFDLGQGLE